MSTKRSHGLIAPSGMPLNQPNPFEGLKGKEYIIRKSKANAERKLILIAGVGQVIGRMEVTPDRTHAVRVLDFTAEFFEEQPMFEVVAAVLAERGMIPARVSTEPTPVPTGVGGIEP